MKAEISVRIIHAVREPEIPDKEFVRTASMGIELPVADDKDFLNALDSLVSGHLSTLIIDLCAKARKSGDKYLEEARASGIKQPELPFQANPDEQPKPAEEQPK